CGKAPNVPDIVLLGMRAQAAHQHILLHELTKRRGGGVNRLGSHGEFLSLKETPSSDQVRLDPKPIMKPRPRRTHPPAKRVRAWGTLRPKMTEVMNVAFVALAAGPLCTHWRSAADVAPCILVAN